MLVVRDYQAEAEVLCISSEVRQVFANILANAFDATPYNGTVTVRVRNSSHFSSSEAGVRVTIADTGCGMTLATQKQLFQPFYSTKGRNGTGLGLWISQEILARHGVTTRVRSRQGASRNGTVFVLCFPRDTGPRSLEAVQSEVQAELMRDIHRDGQLLHHDSAYQSSS